MEILNIKLLMTCLPMCHIEDLRLITASLRKTGMTRTCLQERVYDVGSHCASRVHLYHSLWHYKRRLRCQLKKELKAARLFLEVPLAHLPHLPEIT